MSLKPFAHQIEFRRIARERSRFAFFAGCGIGKTIGTLLICEDRPMKTLVLAPKTILRAAWLKDAGHFPSIRAKVIDASSRNRARDIAATDWDLVATNYAFFKPHAEHFIAAGVRRLIVDESAILKNPDSQITKAVHRFCDKVDEVYLCSGVPAPNSGVEYYGQLRALGRNVCGTSYWSFCYRFFYPIKEKVRIKGGKIKEVISGWKQTPEQAAKLAALLKQHGWSLTKEQCLDLPRKTDIIIDVELGDEADVYQRAEDDLILEVKDADCELNPQSLLMKLRQITGGTVKDTSGQLHSTGRAKLDALAEILDQVGPKEPVVIWAEFTAEIDAIAGVVRARGESVDIIDGRTSGRAAEIAASFQSGGLKRLVCHPAAAGHGITLTAASYAVYYSVGFSYEQHEQSRDRIHRAGQTRPCTYYYLVARDTVDEGTLGTVRHKATAADAMRKILSRRGVDLSTTETSPIHA